MSFQQEIESLGNIAKEIGKRNLEIIEEEIEDCELELKRLKRLRSKEAQEG